jgi:2-oxoglutarate dehydrogenase E2 component (dihydrolipoamide succinyltransferase)
LKLITYLSFFFWHAVPGDFVQADEVVARIETDKVTVDILAPESGIIKEYFAAEGDTVNVGAKFYVLDTDGKPGAESTAPKTPAAAEPVAAEKASSVPQPAAAAPKQVSRQNLFSFFVLKGEGITIVFLYGSI